MAAYLKPVQIRWSDLDPNFHVRHSVYYDFGAFIRICAFTDFGLNISVLAQHNIGPILFREECAFKRELHFGDNATINLFLKKCSPNYSRWTIEHEIMKDAETLAAIITIDGAWIDTKRRKLVVPGELVKHPFDQLPRSADFEWIEKKQGGNK